jgi:hypothetical protein
MSISTFVGFSSLVTGFSEFQLFGTGLAGNYYSTVTGIVGKQTTEQLLEAYVNLTYRRAEDGSNTDELLREGIFFDAKLGPIARNVIKLWYVGTWYQLPFEWRSAFGTLAGDRTFVVSPVAYTEGMLWRAIDANPSGAKGPGFGTWAYPPQIPSA